MFIIFGFGHKTVKKYGDSRDSPCQRRNGKVSRELIQITHWITLFFIPVIPYKREYYVVCPECGFTAEIGKHDFIEKVDGSSAATGLEHTMEKPRIDKYLGKTETQINYLKQMERLEAERNDK